MQSKNNIIDRFVSKLKYIGITVELTGNYPWIYLDTVNGKKVNGKFMANHGFTAFLLKHDGSIIFSDRKEVFKKIRETI